MIFVFGSNLSGVHGAGAARYALENKGAVLGVGEGRTGSSYALPTKGHAPRLPVLTLTEIRNHAERFIEHAAGSEETFQLTAVGCGLAGYTAEQIAPLFKSCPENVMFPPEWRAELVEFPEERFWSY